MPPAKRRASHMYSVWVNTETGTTMVYFGNSEAAARTAFAKAVINNPDSHSVEIRRDLRSWLRVLIERQS